MTDLFDRNPSPSDDEIRHHLRGNLCRCTGYVKYHEAVRAVILADPKRYLAAEFTR